MSIKVEDASSNSTKRNYIFPVSPYSPLQASEFTRNPPAPSLGQLVRVHITHIENGSKEDKEAELIYVGNAGAKRQVHGKNVRFVAAAARLSPYSSISTFSIFSPKKVDPGWIVILPIEGEYTIYAENLTYEPLGLSIFVDGFGKENQRFIGLEPFGKHKRTFHIIKTEDSFLTGLPLSAGASDLPEGFGSIKIRLRRVKRRQYKYRDYSRDPKYQASSSAALLMPTLAAEKKQATTFLARTVPQKKSSSFKDVWSCYGDPIWEITMAYRGEAWAITGGFLPRKFNDDDDDHGNANNIFESAAKRQKIESEEDRKVRVAMEALSYDSSCQDFFFQVSQLLDRDSSDFDPVLDALEEHGIDEVSKLAKVSDAQFMTTHLPDEYSDTRKRMLSNLIRQHLELVPRPIIRIDIDDD